MRKKQYLLLLCLLCISFCGCSQTSKEVTTSIESKSTNKVEQSDENTVLFSLPAGFYKSSITLALSGTEENTTIYYTTDGSIPTKDAILYTAPITLDNPSSQPNKLSVHKDICPEPIFEPREKIAKANIIRAVSYDEAGNASQVQTATYFVGIDQAKKYPDVPVISLVTEEANLFDYETGIYVMGKSYDDWLAADPANKHAKAWQVQGNFSNRGKEWERPMHFEYFAPSGKQELSVDMGVRMKGCTTRTYYQKSMRLFARKDYGTSKITYPLIPDNPKSDGSGPVSSYKSFALRNGGNACDFGKIRDPFLQELIADRNIETQQSTPCVVFLNGEYWGLYAITEDYTDDYFKENYGIDKKELIIVKGGEIEEGEEEDLSLFQEMYDFITQNDMKDNANYQKAQEYLSIPDFIDYCAFQLYIDNRDSIFFHNNWSFWRVRHKNTTITKADTKWRPLLFDTEYSTDVYGDGHGYVKDNLKEALVISAKEHAKNIEEARPIEIFYSLYENPAFQADFIQALCDLRNYDFEKDHAIQIAKKLGNLYAPLAGDSLRRNGPDWAVDYIGAENYFKGKQTELQLYMGGRYIQFPTIMKKVFSLSDPVSLSLELSDAACGTIQINHTLLDFSRFSMGVFSGIYFPEYPVTLQAIPNEGHKFIGWESDCDTLSSTTDPSICVTLHDACHIKAIFE